MIIKLAAFRFAKHRNYNKVGKKFASWILPKSAVGEFGHSLMKHAGQTKEQKEIEQLHVQLAGVGVAALGGTKPSMTVKKFGYGWSPAYQDTLNLRKKYDKLLKEKEK